MSILRKFTAAEWVGLATALLGLAISFGAHITATQEHDLLGVIALIATVVLGNAHIQNGKALARPAILQQLIDNAHQPAKAAVLLQELGINAVLTPPPVNTTTSGGSSVVQTPASATSPAAAPPPKQTRKAAGK